MPFVVGETVGPYRILTQLGQGGMATVYKAYHTTLDRYVAIKVLHQAFLAEENFKARFLREARLVARLEHPNIVPVYDFAEHAGQPYLVMKFIEGETLKARMARGPLSAQEALDIVEAVGAALSYAHRQGVLHRDVKPSNVILGRDGSIYLADFGLARIAAGGSATLTNDMIIGTPQYIAPEQAMGKKDLDERTDVYSFGVMLYEIAVGQVPFSADTPFAIIHDHIYSPLPLPREVNPNVPPELERVLLKALAKEREDRYPTVEALVAAFRTAWLAAGIPDHPETLSLAREALPPPPLAPLEMEEKTASVSAPTPPPAPPSPAEEAETASAAPRRWGWLAAGLLLLVTLWVLITARRLPAAPPVPAFTPTAAMSMEHGEPGHMGAETDESPSLQAARRQVQASPDDPWAYFELGLVLWQENAPVAAVEEFAAAGKVAGDDVELLLALADEAAIRGIWPGAARLYYQATRVLGVETPGEVWDAWYEAVYESSVDALAPILLDWANWERVDINLRNFGQARYFYYQGDTEKAYKRLDDLYAISDDFPPARFLEAEFALEEGRYEDARALLEGLQTEPLLPDWMTVRVAQMLAILP